MQPNTDNQIEGQRILAIRGMTDRELEREDWSTQRGDSPPVIELESGILLHPPMDPEGNGPGALFSITPDNEAFLLSS